MGMYNEVYKCCPNCGELSIAQIPQITLGFGEFDLDNPKSISDKLTLKQCIELRESVSQTWFGCTNQKCQHNFKIESSDDESEKIKILITLLKT